MEPRTPDGPPALTARQMEVARLVADGLTNAQIAARLDISLDGAKRHVREVIARAGLSGRDEIAGWWEARQPGTHRRLRAAWGAPLLRVAGAVAAATAIAATVLFALAVRPDANPDAAGQPPATAASAVVVTATPVATPTPRPEPTPQPSLESLYRLRPYRPRVQGSSQIGGPITRIPPPDLAAANAEGPLWQGEFTHAGPYPAVFDGVEGSAEPTCVEAGGSARVRSNDFVLDVSAWAAPDYTFELFPANVDDLLEPGSDFRLFLRATRLTDERATHLHELDVRPRPDANGDVSYSPSFVLPRAGVWLVAVSAGPQWGCFVLGVDDPIPTSVLRSRVAEIEAGGAARPSLPAPDAPSPSFSAERGRGVVDAAGYSRRGTPDRICVDVETIHDARSGDWVMRPAGPYAVEWPLPSSATKFVPLHQPRSLPEPEERTAAEERLLLTATLLNAPIHTYVFEQPFFTARTGDPDTQSLEFSHIAAFVIPRAGTWALVVTSGPDWGCFLLTLGR